MEPVEVRGRLRAFEKNVQREAQKRDQEALNRDQHAWMIGYYVRLARNKKMYPDKPSLIKIKKSKEEQPDPDAMKDRMGMFAEAHNAAEEAKTLNGNDNP